MYKYKLMKKRNPQKPDEPQKWYAAPMSEAALSVKAMTRAATENTTTAPIEMESAFELFMRYAVQQLQQGHTVRVGNLGTMRVSFKSDGVENIDDFSPSSMIRDVRVLFTPSRELREAVTGDLQFTIGGVLDEGVNYNSLTDYKRAKGLLPDDGSQGGGSTPGTGEDSGEDGGL